MNRNLEGNYFFEIKKYNNLIETYLKEILKYFSIN